MLAPLLLLLQVGTSAPPAYFPAWLAGPVPSCRWGGKKVLRTPRLSDLERAWYGGALRAAEEPSLYARAQGERSRGTTIRFTWLRSFDAPIIVRVEGIGAPSPRLIAKRLSGKGGYGPGAIDTQIDRPLSEAEVGAIAAVLAQGTPFAGAARPAPLPECGPPPIDGAEWVVERVDGTGYHFAKDFSPRGGAVRATGLATLALTGWPVEPIY